jgi:WD40 repeat protein
LFIDPATGAVIGSAERYVNFGRVRCSLQFSPDGRRYATVSEDGKAVHVWSMPTLKASQE